MTEQELRKWRKERPVFSGVLRYFPDALLEVAHLSFVGNEQHNPGTPLHWDRSKSTDEPDALVRHLIEAGTLDTDGVRHSAKVAWRALAMLQKEIEAERAAKPSSDLPAHTIDAQLKANLDAGKVIQPARCTCPLDGERNCCEGAVPVSCQRAAEQDPIGCAAKRAANAKWDPEHYTTEIA